MFNVIMKYRVSSKDYIMSPFINNYLGIVLDSSLNYKLHIGQCSKIVSHKIYLLPKIGRFINEETAIFISKSMIAPIFYYGDILYVGGTASNLSKLQLIQNRALRICLDIHHYLPTILLHQHTNVPNLVTRRSCNIQKYMFKQKKNVNLINVPDQILRNLKITLYIEELYCGTH